MNKKAIFRKSVLGVAVAAVSVSYQQAAIAATDNIDFNVLISATGSSGNVTVNANDIYLNANQGSSFNQFIMNAGADLTINAEEDVNVNADTVSINANGGGAQFNLGSQGPGTNDRCTTGNCITLQVNGTSGDIQLLATGSKGGVWATASDIVLNNAAQNTNSPVPVDSTTVSANVTGAGSNATDFFGSHPLVNGFADDTYTGTQTTYDGTGTTSEDYFTVNDAGTTTVVSDTVDQTTTTWDRTVEVDDGLLDVDTYDQTMTVAEMSTSSVVQKVGDFDEVKRGYQLTLVSSGSVETTYDCETNGGTEACTPNGVNSVNEWEKSGLVEHTAERSQIAHSSTDSEGSTSSLLDMDADSIWLGVNNTLGNAHGLTIGTSSTSLSGGTTSTTLTLDNGGAHLDNVLDMNGNQINEVAAGTLATDAVNKGQLDAEVSRATAAEGDRNYTDDLTGNGSPADGTNLDDGESLTEAINTENVKRIADVNKEEADRIADVNAEESARISADNQLQAGLDSETMARKNADNKLNDRVDDVEGGVAAAIALTTAQTPSAAGKTAVSIGAGFYAGENAIGVNVVHRLANDGNIGVGVAQSSGNGDTAAKVSYGFEF